MTFHFLSICCTLSLITVPGLTSGYNYSEALAFHNDKLDAANYNPQIRPILNQYRVLKVDVHFELVSIVEINDVEQSFICNGFIFFQWKDELLTRNETVEHLSILIHPFAKKIWRPRVILLNTIGKRDLFKDDHATANRQIKTTRFISLAWPAQCSTIIIHGACPVFIDQNGTVEWVPGSLFTTSCKLDLTCYPFDDQICMIKELRFNTMNSTVIQSDYTENGEWDVQETQITTPDIGSLSSVNISFLLKRRPAFFLLNVLLPVAFLSVLNIFAIAIPVESGEKIGFGVTVLLALSLYMNTVSGMLPKSSLSLPYVVIYLFILLTLSLIIVIGNIIVVFLHNLEEKEETHQRVQANFNTALTKVTLVRRALMALTRRGKESNFNQPQINTISEQPGPTPKPDVSSTDDNTETKRPKINKYKVIGRYINFILFCVFLVIYITVTLWFIISIAISPVPELLKVPQTV